MSDPLSVRILRYLPKNLVSRLFGFIASRRRPRFLVRPFMRWFANHFDLNLSEAERSFEDYDCLLAMFTRRLKPGARTIDPSPDAFVSPVDGRIGAFGRIEDGQLLQAKGMYYSVESLLGDAKAAAEFAHGSFITIYLSPRDYHRIHVPREGAVTKTLYEPGTLWPVNPPAVRSLPNLFAVNERVTSVMSTEVGATAVAMVGATNVGSIGLAYDDMSTNCGGPRQHLCHEPAIPVARGGDLGVFKLGSTVVVLVANPEFRFEAGLSSAQWLPMGQLLGRFKS